MTDGIPQVVLGINEASDSVVIVDGTSQVSDLAQLIASAPALLHPDAAATLAKALNHFSHGTDYYVIGDTTDYEEKYRAKVAKEDPAAAWQEGVLRLRDHGIPDFSTISEPVLNGTMLVYYAADSYIGLPYRIEYDLANPASAAKYNAVSLTPFPPAPTPAPALNPLFVGSGAKMAPRTGGGGLVLEEAPLILDDIGDDDEPDEP